jgi:hypothetical protein
LDAGLKVSSEFPLPERQGSVEIAYIYLEFNVFHDRRKNFSLLFPWRAGKEQGNSGSTGLPAFAGSAGSGVGRSQTGVDAAAAASLIALVGAETPEEP